MLDSALPASAMNCHLVVSDLLCAAMAGAASSGELDLPALELLIARGQRAVVAGGSTERWLGSSFGVCRDGDPALAPFSLRGEGDEPGGHGWLRADPVHLRLHADRIVLADASRLSITADEADELIAALNAHFAHINIAFLAPRSDRWYVRLEHAPSLRATPTAEVAGRAIDACLPTGDEQALWRSIFNETQMLLHEHPCNQRREQRGELAVNSLWFWGAGTDSRPRADVRFDAVWSDDPAARGLALACGVPARPLPQRYTEFIQSAAGAGFARDSRHLVILPPVPGAAYGDAGTWREAVERIERDWLAPLLAGTLAGAPSAITLHALGPHQGLQVNFSRAHRLRIWRRRKRFAEYCA